MSIFTKRDGAAIVSDGSGKTFTFTDVGDVQLGPLHEGQAPALPVMERGSIADYVRGDEPEVSGTFTCNLRTATFSDGTTTRPLDVVMKTGAWSSATSTLSGAVTGDPFAVKLELRWVKGGITAEIEVNPCFLTVDSINESGETLQASISFHGKYSAKT